ncbi:hypothetical protein [Kitasatospora sp. NBC_01266]|uniref:hypothetical protein n=1 Tax=Kitasatospora sp. NBC_01266 TaxID=2903572 RepID=UPI002E2FC145|nr:hypothetical protein [Kitasatospora sp. NBC_01266]
MSSVVSAAAVSIRGKGRAGGALLGGLAVALPAVALLGGCAAQHAAPAPKPSPTAPFVAFNACLVTGPAGLAPDAVGAQAWAGTQAAAGSLRARASYVTAAPANLAGALGGLLLKRCTLIVAAGDSSAGDGFDAGVAGFAQAHPGQRFLLVGGAGAGAGAGGAGANVRVVAAGDGLADRVRQAVAGSAAG